MENDEVVEKIKKYCEKINMNDDNLIIQSTEDGNYIAKNKDTSLLFDKDGNVKSLPLYKPYGKGNYIFGKVSSIVVTIMIILVVLIAIVSFFKR